MEAKPARSHSRLVVQPARASRHPRSLWYRMWLGRTGYIMLVPTLVLLGVFQYYPAVSGLYRSMYRWSAGLPARYIGLGNFIELFTRDRIFIRSLGNMAQLTGWSLFSAISLSVLVAVPIYHLKNAEAKYIFRLFMVLPVIIPGVVFFLLWMFIYDATVGPLNASLTALGLEGWTRAWLADPKTALYALMFRGFPWVDGVSVLIVLAGLQAIPEEVIEYSTLDGAEGLRRLWYIELPMVAGQVKLIGVLTLMGGIGQFSSIWAMTQGGPINSTQVPGMWMYRNAFGLGKMGYASAIGVVIFLITLIATIITLQYNKQ